MQRSTKKKLQQQIKISATNLGNSRISYEHAENNLAEEPLQDEAAHETTMKDVSRLNISQEEEDRE